MKSFNLNSLEALSKEPAMGAAAADAGKPLLLNVEELEEDPENSRMNFDPVTLQELAANVKKRGIKSPLSVKPKGSNGKHRINHGHRRFRAAKLAGLTEVPCIIDEQHDSIDGLVENILRDDLTAFEIGAAVVKELAKPGKTVTSLAAETGKSKTWISRYKAIGEAPEVFRKAKDKFGDASAAYDLIAAYTEKPHEVEKFIAETDNITRADVTLFLNPVRAPSTVDDGSKAPVPTDENPQRGKEMGSKASLPSEKPPAGSGAPKSQKRGAGLLPASDLEGLFNRHVDAAGDVDKALEGHKPSDIEALAKPLVKLAKQGLSTTDSDFYSVLVDQFKSGAFSVSGAGLYRLCAFVEGKIGKGVPESTQLLQTVLRNANRFVEAGE